MTWAGCAQPADTSFQDVWDFKGLCWLSKTERLLKTSSSDPLRSFGSLDFFFLLLFFFWTSRAVFFNHKSNPRSRHWARAKRLYSCGSLCWGVLLQNECARSGWVSTSRCSVRSRRFWRSGPAKRVAASEMVKWSPRRVAAVHVGKFWGSKRAATSRARQVSWVVK